MGEIQKAMPAQCKPPKSGISSRRIKTPKKLESHSILVARQPTLTYFGWSVRQHHRFSPYMVSRFLSTLPRRQEQQLYYTSPPYNSERGITLAIQPRDTLGCAAYGSKLSKKQFKVGCLGSRTEFVNVKPPFYHSVTTSIL